jgi:hypothetical protein
VKNLNELHAKLIAAARKNPPGGRVPYAFEKRVVTRLRAATPPNAWALWGRPLWQAAMSCVAITLLCGLWSYASHLQREKADNFSQEFEAVVFAPVNEQLEETW